MKINIGDLKKKTLNLSYYLFSTKDDYILALR